MNKNKEKVPKIRFPGFTEPWEQRKVGEWGTFYYGHSCPKWSVTEDATTPCIRYGELYTKFGAKIDKVFSYTNMPTDKLRFSKGTEVLIPRVGEDPMDYNHCTWLSIPGVAIGEMISVYNTEQNPLFTATMFNATLQKEFASRVEGGSVTNLYFEKLKNIDVWFPSLVEQEKIAAYFEQFDNLITLHQRKLNHLKDKKKGLLQKMFPKNGELVPELRFPEFTDPWEQRKLGDVVSYIVDNRGKNPTYYCSEGIPVIDNFMIKNTLYPELGTATRFIDEELYQNFIRKYNEIDDILLTLVGNGIGNISLFPADKAVIIQNTLGLRTDENKRFLFFLLMSKNQEIVKLDRGMAQPSIRQDEILDISIKIPKMEEQEKIGTYFSNLDNLITLHQRKLDHLKEQKKALLQQMFI